jgi:arylsulfatase A-like enzyme
LSLTAVTDDQDSGTIERRFLPRIHEHLVDHGVSYDNFFAPVSICCPSRVSLLRTQYAHNHNITFVSAPWGGWDVFNKYGYVGHTLPDHLQAAGYSTYYVGKLMNDHTEDNCESLPVSGFVSVLRSSKLEKD